MISVKRTSVRKMIVGYYVVLPKVQIPLPLVRLVQLLSIMHAVGGNKSIFLEYWNLRSCCVAAGNALRPPRSKGFAEGDGCRFGPPVNVVLVHQDVASAQKGSGSLDKRCQNTGSTFWSMSMVSWVRNTGGIASGRSLRSICAAVQMPPHLLAEGV